MRSSECNENSGSSKFCIKTSADRTENTAVLHKHTQSIDAVCGRNNNSVRWVFINVPVIIIIIIIIIIIRSYSGYNRGDWNHVKIPQTIPE
jgi:hypothetical protein